MILLVTKLKSLVFNKYKRKLNRIMLESFVIPNLASDLLKEAEKSYLIDQKFSNETLTELYAVFGNVFYSATELLETCKIILYQTKDKCRRIYKIGNNMERYTIYLDVNFCHCQQFQRQVLEDGTSLTCKHVLAVILNKITGNSKVQIETVTDSQFVEFLNEQLNYVNEDNKTGLNELS